jgi:CHASE2 domain-containing sensor protein
VRKILLPVLLVCAIVIISCDRRAVAEGEIVLINTDTVDREGIAHELDAINAFNPKLVAIDVQFSGDTDARKDTILLSALKHTKNLIMVSIIDDYGGGEHTHYRRFASGSLPAFLAVAKTGFANTIVEENEMRTLNRFSTHAYVAEHIEYHFAVRVAMAFDSLLAVRYVKNHPRIVDVDYRNGARHFKVFGSADVLGKKIPRKDIEGKIVMLGFLGPGNEDKFFTPLNTNADEPDMHGLLYLAHIVAQILETR